MKLKEKEPLVTLSIPTSVHHRVKVYCAKNSEKINEWVCRVLLNSIKTNAWIEKE
jgi:predicted HicB family RNase H-like nuclease